MAEAGAVPAAGAPRAASPAREALLALLLALAFRALYLARFGGDPCWMNGNFLLDAKAMRFGYPAEFYGMPLVRGLLLALRDAGLGATASLAVGYLAGQALLALGTFGLARTLFGERPRMRAAAALAVAVLPAFATDAGYRNVSATLGAGLFASLAALLLPAPGGARGPVRLGLAAALAAAAAACRPEAALAIGALALALLLAGRRLGTGRPGAVAALAGLFAGVVAVRIANQLAAGKAGLSPRVWAYYTFLEADPLLVRAWAFLHDPASVASEYARYIHSRRALGGFEENGGSIATALLRHPGTAAVWLLAKPFDFVATVFLPDAFTPLAVVPLFLAVRRARREGWGATARAFAPLLAAYLAVLGFLLVWSQGHAPYLLILAPALLLVLLWGLEPWLAPLSPRVARGLGVAVAGLGAAAVLWLGHPSSFASSPALDAAARWLEARCAGRGCLVNALPEPLNAAVWADLQAGAPLPMKDKRAEAFVLRQYPPGWVEGVRFENRVAAARANGFGGLILYVHVDTRTMKPFDDEFDAEHREEGRPDLAGRAPVASFREGPDRVEVYELPGGALSGLAPDLRRGPQAR